MWWDPQSLGDGCVHAQLGELGLWIRQEPREVIVSSSRDPEADPEGLTFDTGTEPGDVEARRFVMSDTKESVTFQPRLAERSVVVRPRIPVYLPPGQRASIFVTTPLNVLLLAGDVLLEERSIWNPPETWFGASPVDGELCYASRTSGTRQRAELSVPPTRAVTEVLLENEGAETLEAKSIRLPMTRLNLAWDASDACLVTETVRLVRKDASNAELRVEALPNNTTVLAPPRHKSAPVWKHALAALWS